MASERWCVLTKQPIYQERQGKTLAGLTSYVFHDLSTQGWCWIISLSELTEHSRKLCTKPTGNRGVPQNVTEGGYGRHSNVEDSYQAGCRVHWHASGLQSLCFVDTYPAS